MKKNLFLIALISALCITIMIPAAAMASGTFAVSEGSIKIADGSNGGYIPTYGPGKNIAIKNNEIFVGMTYNKTWSTSPVTIGIVNSADLGATWERVWPIAESSNYDGNGAHIAISNSPANNRIEAHLIWGSSSANAIYYGDTYGTTPVLVNGSESADTYGRSIATDSAANVYVLYRGWDSSNNYSIYYSKLSYNSGTHKYDLDVAGGQVRACTYGCNTYPDITVDGNDVPYAAWTETDSSGNEKVYVSKMVSGSWQSPVSIEGAYPAYNYLSIASSGSNVCVAWDYYIDNPTPTADESGMAATCSSNGTSWNTPDKISNDSAVDQPSIAVDSNGVPGVVWSDYTYVKFSTYSGNKWTSAETIEEAYSSWDPKIAVDGSNKFHVVYPSKRWTVMQYSHQ